MSVIKRDGTRESVQFDKVLERIRRAARGLSAAVNYTRLAQLVLAEIHDGVHTTELDELAARLAISYVSTNPEWGTLAAQIIVSNCQRSAPATFSAAMELLATVRDARGNPAPALAPDVLAFIRKHAAALDAIVDPARDFALDYFGFKTLEKGYLMRGPGRKIAETPQYLWLRVAVGLWGCSHTPEDAGGSSHAGVDIPVATRLERIRETYDLMSQKAFTHATPTLFNSGTPRPQMSSCYLIAMRDDSVDGIFDTLKDCAQISKYAGGIGLHVHNIRAAGSHIAGTNGTSDGLVPMLRVFNNTARYINQGGRRNGSFAIYLEPWHADVQAFLKLKSNTGTEEERARDLFYAMWVPDLFMRRVETGGNWSLFCPHEAPGLADVHGAAFDELYTRYEAEGRARATIPAQKLWSEILVSQIETGTPYLLYKDAANAKSNQKNLGTIKSSNLCVAPETLILTDKGNMPISMLEGQTVNVWNGDKWSETTVSKTGVHQKLLKVVINLRDGAGYLPSVPGASRGGMNHAIYCTPYHKFILPTHDSIAECERIEARHLTVGQTLKCFNTNVKSVVEPTVVSIEDYGRYDDTYCFNEPLNHAGVFNGVLTGNCTEILEYSSPEETAVCNLASIALPHFVSKTTTPPSFDFTALRAVVAVAVRNLNRVIDINFYPTPETKRSNMRHRPVGLGVQGLADVFALLGMAWETSEAALLNRRIFEHIYYAAIHASATLAAAEGPYETYVGSPASYGLLQPDLWGLPPADFATKEELDWPALYRHVGAHGLRNSLLMAPMPTASTSQILGFNECIEPFTTNIYARRTLAGEFTVVNRYLVADLQAAGLWSPELKERIIAANGSIQGLPEVPADLKARYKTVWEIKQKTLIDMAADRGAFICQSQSLNLFVQDPTIAKLSSMHFYAWKRGLKTGIYYLRTKSAVQAIKFTVDPRLVAATASLAASPAPSGGAGTAPEPAECLLCSS